MCYKGNKNYIIIAVRMYLLNLQFDLYKFHVPRVTATVESKQDAVII